MGAAAEGRSAGSAVSASLRSVQIAWLCGALTFCVSLAVVSTPPRSPYWIIDGAAKGVMAERLLASGYRDFCFENPGGRIDPEG